MNKNFKNILAKANMNKNQFDSSVEGIKDALDTYIKFDKRSMPLITATKPSTGWLRGALSYPWIFVCIVIPAVMDMFV